MNFGELKCKTIKELKVVCKSDRSKYKGYSFHTRKVDLITYIIRRNSESHSPQTQEVISDLTDLFETNEDVEERYNEMYMERPHDYEIQDLISSLRSIYTSSNVIFDNHNDHNNDIIYKGNKGKYISQYNSLGENGEMILYHGTNGKNLMSIMADDFRLTTNPVHGSLFGRGIYFTNDIQKAIHYSDRGKTKYVIVCVVHIGDICKGHMNMHIHPKMPDSDKQFDTSVDNITDPKQFIKKKNGTYNILGIITIENYIENVDRKLTFSGSFKLENRGKEDIGLYWVPDKYLPVKGVDILRYKRLERIRGGQMTNKPVSCQIGHTFMCVAKQREKHNVSQVNIVKVFKSKGKDEMFYC